MASKKDIITAVVNTLREATGTYDEYELTLDEIRPSNPNGIESDMGIVWTDTYTRRNVNGVGNAVTKTYEDNADTYSVVEKETYTEEMTAQFLITLDAPTVSVLDELYETVHKSFGKYKATSLSPRTFHEHVSRVEVTNVASVDDTDSSNVRRRDQVTVQIDFERLYDEETDNINEIQLSGDGDYTEVTYTIP